MYINNTIILPHSLSKYTFKRIVGLLQAVPGLWRQRLTLNSIQSHREPPGRKPIGQLQKQVCLRALNQNEIGIKQNYSEGYYTRIYHVSTCIARY